MKALSNFKADFFIEYIITNKKRNPEGKTNGLTICQAGTPEKAEERFKALQIKSWKEEILTIEKVDIEKSFENIKLELQHACYYHDATLERVLKRAKSLGVKLERSELKEIKNIFIRRGVIKL